MRLFYYAHTGHRIGLDRFRRAATIIRALGDIDITLLTSDFRIASQAKAYGIQRAVGVDVVRNIPQIANNGDTIIFDSAEINPVLLEDMTRYFSTFIRVCDDPDTQKHSGELLISPYLEGEGIFTGVAVDNACFETREKTIARALFYGDDDYEEDLASHQQIFADLQLQLLEGFYWFYGYADKLHNSFTQVNEEQTYDEVIARTDRLISASPQAVLENLAGGGHPVYLQRPDYPADFIPLFESLGIPVVRDFDRNTLTSALSENPLQKYHACPKTTDALATFLKQNLNL